uniref:hypothetical protein n=1 Tax=Pseudomonas viridiflava TaxID=33069 RepID=UPI0019D1DF81
GFFLNSLAMNDDSIFLTHRVDLIAGKRAPTTFCLLQESAVSKTQGRLPQPDIRHKAAQNPPPLAISRTTAKPNTQAHHALGHPTVINRTGGVRAL